MPRDSNKDILPKDHPLHVPIPLLILLLLVGLAFVSLFVVNLNPRSVLKEANYSIQEDSFYHVQP